MNGVAYKPGTEYQGFIEPNVHFGDVEVSEVPEPAISEILKEAPKDELLAEIARLKAELDSLKKPDLSADALNAMKKDELFALAKDKGIEIKEPFDWKTDRFTLIAEIREKV